LGEEIEIFSAQFVLLLSIQGKWRSVDKKFGWYALEKEKHHSICVLTTWLIYRYMVA
jgi:hypothetical protein